MIAPRREHDNRALSANCPVTVCGYDQAADHEIIEVDVHNIGQREWWQSCVSAAMWDYCFSARLCRSGCGKKCRTYLRVHGSRFRAHS